MKLTWSQLRVCRVRLFPFGLRMYTTEADYPQITVPQKMIERIQKIKTRQALEQAKKKKIDYKSPLIISGKRQEYNHHIGQPFSEFDVKKFSSHGWKHPKSKGDYFTIKNHNSNPALQEVSEDVQLFDEFGLDDSILNVLKQQGITIPTKIQSKMIPVMLQGHNVICAAETGSGKTYAYLLPVLHNMLKERSSLEVDSSPVPNSPKAIITAPSHELIHQLTSVLRLFEEELSISVVNIGEKDRRQKTDRLMDVLIIPPGSLNSMLNRKHIRKERLSSFILDEADTLLDDSFSGLIRKILTQLQVGVSQPTEHSAFVSEGVQVGLVSATYPRGLETLLEPILSLENFEVVKTGHLHRLMPHVPQKFMRFGSSDKLRECAKLLKNYEGKPTLVFCNKTDTSLWLSKSLEDLGVNNLLLTGYDSYQVRSKHLRSFLEGGCDVLVCTDIASRGLDTQCVHHVINYDFPLFMSDYIHRAGRVGRVGTTQNCQVTSLITYSWDVDLLWKIELAARRQKALHNVNANIKRKINSIILERYGEEDENEDSE